MRYLFRLEGPKVDDPCYETGKGMAGAYMAGIGYLNGLKGDYYGSDHPCPMAFDTDVSPDEYFAFDNLKDCQRWWYHREDLALAQEKGFRLLLIPVEDVAEVIQYPRQVTYKPKPWGQGDCPVIRRVYLNATDIHILSQEEMEAWADEVLARRQQIAA